MALWTTLSLATLLHGGGAGDVAETDDAAPWPVPDGIDPVEGTGELEQH